MFFTLGWIVTEPWPAETCSSPSLTTTVLLLLMTDLQMRLCAVSEQSTLTMYGLVLILRIGPSGRATASRTASSRSSSGVARRAPHNALASKLPVESGPRASGLQKIVLQEHCLHLRSQAIRLYDDIPSVAVHVTPSTDLSLYSILLIIFGKCN